MLYTLSNATKGVLYVDTSNNKRYEKTQHAYDVVRNKQPAENEQKIIIEEQIKNDEHEETEESKNVIIKKLYKKILIMIFNI